ncbi:MAG: hypothetical protein JXB49_23470, partial [Bacteroidales bacterium]|nr:hypothetical protein [Bacteroidales bacterium]
MRKRNFALRMALLSVAMTILFIYPTFAQGDILDLCPVPMGQEDCASSPIVLIPFNFDATGNDSVLVIRNILGYRLLDPGVADKKYKFCAPNNPMCSTFATDDGEFHLRFTDNLGNPINDMYRVTFIIKTN